MSENVEPKSDTTTTKPAAKKAAPKKSAAKKAAESAPVKIENVVVEEAKVVNDEGQKVISGPKQPKPTRTSNMQSTDDNTLVSRAADRALSKEVKAQTDYPVVEKPKKDPKEDKDKVALWSNRNMRWTGVGALSKGYNIVTKEAAEKWLTRRDIREATPEEVATYYGK